MLTKLKGFKFVITLVLEFKKKNSKWHKTKYSNFYSNTETIINESYLNDAFESIYSTIISNIQKSLGNVLGWITDSAMDYNINISKYNPLVGLVEVISNY